MQARLKGCAALDRGLFEDVAGPAYFRYEEGGEGEFFVPCAWAAAVVFLPSVELNEGKARADVVGLVRKRRGQERRGGAEVG